MTELVYCIDCVLKPLLSFSCSFWACVVLDLDMFAIRKLRLVTETAF